ncbi:MULTISPECIES: J domain-containing protein [unclassified Sphingomonas]|jgi:DnaJ domain|uniref:J domain-containing protein n=3 Tax=Pseudomonadota TaxID=1224 RepID=UPI0010F4B1E7|nr:MULTISPECIES: J domain-containing protein [unclassified Sphingomonas]
MRAPDDIDPYEVLGLNPKADDVVIRAAWKALIRKYHPDASTAPDAAERSARINAAFKLLVTAEARTAYDRRRTQPATAPQRPAPTQAWQSAGPRHRAPPQPARRRASRRRKLALVGLAILLVSAPTLYLAVNDIHLPAPVQRTMDGLLTNPSVAQVRGNARRLLGLDAPPVFAAASSATEASAAPPPPIDKAAIVATVERFVVLSRQGGDAVTAKGRDCVAQVRDTPSWTALDNCTALHIAGLAAGNGLFEGPDPNAAYFDEATPLMSGRYAALSGDDALVNTRIDRIRAMVWPTLLSKYEAQVRARQPRNAVELPSP